MLPTMIPILASGASASAATPFSPSDISDLSLWLDANDLSSLFQDSAKTTPVTANNDPVGAWADKSGNGRDATQATAGLRPTYLTGVANGLPGIKHENSSDGGTSSDLAKWLATGSFLTARPYTIYLVANTVAGHYNRGRSIDGTAANWLLGAYLTPPKYAYHYAGSLVGIDGAVGTVYIHRCVASGSNSYYYSNNSSSHGDGGAANPGGLGIGGHTSAGEYAHGHTFEVLVYAAAHTSTEWTQIEAYLAEKWGVTLV